MKTFISALAMTVGFAGAAAAVPVTVDFSEFAHNDNVTAVSLGGGVSASISATGNSASAPDEAWAFDTTLSGTRDGDLEELFTDDGTNFDIGGFGTALIVQEDGSTAADDDANGGVIVFTFNRVVTFLGFDFLDDEDVTATDNNGNTVTIGTPWDNGFATTGVLNWANVQTLTFDFGDNSGAIDNLRFDITPVPVPASLPLLLAGVGGLAFMRRKRG